MSDITDPLGLWNMLIDEYGVKVDLMLAGKISYSRACIGDNSQVIDNTVNQLNGFAGFKHGMIAFCELKEVTGLQIEDILFSLCGVGTGSKDLEVKGILSVSED